LTFLFASVRTNKKKILLIYFDNQLKDYTSLKFYFSFYLLNMSDYAEILYNEID